MSDALMGSHGKTLKDVERAKVAAASLRKAVNWAFTGSAEDGSFLRGFHAGDEYVPSVFLLLDQLDDALLTWPTPQEQDEIRRVPETEPGTVADLRDVVWRPIETAPKDGTEIITRSGAHPDRLLVLRWGRVAYQKEEHKDFVTRVGIVPTHPWLWMPLPPLPSPVVPAQEPEKT